MIKEAKEKKQKPFIETDDSIYYSWDNSVYTGSLAAVGFVAKNPTSPKEKLLVMRPANCKDYLNDAIYSQVANKKSYNKIGELDLNTLRLLFHYSNPTLFGKVKAKKLALKKYVNIIEAKYGWQKSVLQEVSIRIHTKAQEEKIFSGTETYFVWTGDGRYMLNSMALHFVLLLFRYGMVLPNKAQGDLTSFFKTSIKGEEAPLLMKVLRNGTKNDPFFQMMEKNFLERVISNHDYLFKDITIKDFFSPAGSEVVTGTTVHSNYGPYAAVGGGLRHKTVNERMLDIWKST